MYREIVCFIARNKSWNATNGPHVSMNRVDPYTTLSSDRPNKHFMNWKTDEKWHQARWSPYLVDLHRLTTKLGKGAYLATRSSVSLTIFNRGWSRLMVPKRNIFCRTVRFNTGDIGQSQKLSCAETCMQLAPCPASPSLSSTCWVCCLFQSQMSPAHTPENPSCGSPQGLSWGAEVDIL